MSEQIQKLKELIEKSDYIVVGIGEKFGYDWHSLEHDNRYMELCDEIGNRSELQWVIPFLQKLSMEKNKDMKLSMAYSALASLMEGKDAYYITTTIDDYIYDSGVPLNRIVTTCGGFRQLQCQNACSDELIKVPNALLQYVEKLYNKEINIADIIDKYPECPDCGADLVFNQIGVEQYVEAGYLVGWGIYQEWLEKTMNRNTVLLELGAGLSFMSVIRNPFERFVTYNRKSTLYRVHPSLFMSVPGMDGRCVSISEDPMEWILKTSEV